AVLFVLGVPVRRGGVWAPEIILKAGHVTMPSATGSAPGIDEARVTQEVPVKSALRRLALLLLVLPLGLSRPAAATTYMMMSDRVLADQASAVADVKVVGVESSPLVDGPPATDYLVEVNRVLKGEIGR